MSDLTRWRYGPTNHVFAAVEPDTVIEIGSLLWLDVHYATPASAFSMLKSENAYDSQAAFASKFLGVALHRSVAGDATPIRVATTGVFEFDCSDGTFELGDLIGVATTDEIGVPHNSEDASLFNDCVTKVLSGGLAIARVAKREPTTTRIVLVDIRSTVMTGGIK